MHYFSWPPIHHFCTGWEAIKVTGKFSAKRAILIFKQPSKLFGWELVKLPQFSWDDKPVWRGTEKKVKEVLGCPSMGTCPVTHPIPSTSFPEDLTCHCGQFHDIRCHQFLYKTMVPTSLGSWISGKTFIRLHPPLRSLHFKKYFKAKLPFPWSMNCPFYGQRCSDMQRASQHYPGIFFI